MQNRVFSPGAVLRRGLWIGASYGVGYLACELLGALAVMRRIGAAPMLALVTVDLPLYVLGYLLFGAAWGVVLAPPAWWLRRRVPSLVAWGPGVDCFLLACAFTCVAYWWNPEAILDRRVYALIAFCTPLLVVPSLLLVRWLGGRLRRAPRSARIAAAASAIAACGAWWLLSPGHTHTNASRRSGTNGPNVVLIVIDTLRRDHVSAYGYGRETTPNIDLLARQGALVENAVAPEAWTLPSHASMLTGFMPQEHQAHVAHPYLDKTYRTLAEALAEAGYSTAAFSANPWVSRISGLEQGFQVNRYLGAEAAAGFLFLNLARRRIEETDLGGGAVTGALLDWLEEAAASRKPFFAFANYMEVHEPYGSVPEPYFSSFLTSRLPRDIGREWVRETLRFLCAECVPGEVEGLLCRDGRWRATAMRLRDTIDLYDAGVRYVDHQVGRVVQRLRDLGVLDRTLLIVTSDHGEMLGEGGRIGHGNHLYNAVLDVPLVLRYPPIFPAGTRYSQPVSLVDVMPTVEEITGTPSPGYSYARGLLASGSPRERAGIIAEHIPMADESAWRALGRLTGCDLSVLGLASASIQQGAAKFIWKADGANELYDLESDPAEEVNLVGRDPARAGELEARLREQLALLRKGAIEGEPPELDEPTRRALRSLGYLQ
jgi:arylsulfatase A-like enzyme